MNDWQKAALREQWGTMQKVLSSRSRMERVVEDIVFDFSVKPRLASERLRGSEIFRAVSENCGQGPMRACSTNPASALSCTTSPCASTRSPPAPSDTHAPALAAKAATATIPIVFANGADPIQFGLVASLNRPGGNVTGINFLVADLGEKQLGLIHELAPNVAVAVMINPNNPNAESIRSAASNAARSRALPLQVLKAGTTEEIDTAFAKLVEQQLGALLVAADAFFLGGREQFVALAERYRIPAIYYMREFVSAGGLMSYGTNISDAYRRAGVYTGKILKGARPADLPVEQSTKFEFVLNLKTAKALGLTIPDKLLALADDVIE